MPLPFQWHGYRVEDDSSAAYYVYGEGIFARSQIRVPKENPIRLEGMLFDHLDWSNNNPTPFISASTNAEWAFLEARRRQYYGKRNVVVYKISLNGRGQQYNVKYPNFERVSQLLKMARSSVPSYADFLCTEDEWLFFHHIPEEFIMEYWEV